MVYQKWDTTNCHEPSKCTVLLTAKRQCMCTNFGAVADISKTQHITYQHPKQTVRLHMGGYPLTETAGVYIVAKVVPTIG